MAYSEKDDKHDIVDETLELFDKYSSKRDTWAQHAKEDKEFRLGRQWSTEQKETLEIYIDFIKRRHPDVKIVDYTKTKMYEAEEVF